MSRTINLDNSAEQTVTIEGFSVWSRAFKRVQRKPAARPSRMTRAEAL